MPQQNQQTIYMPGVLTPVMPQGIVVGPLVSLVLDRAMLGRLIQPQSSGFPATSLIDAFTGANGPISTSLWQGDTSGDVLPVILSNQAAGSSATNVSTAYTKTLYGVDEEIWADVGTLDATAGVFYQLNLRNDTLAQANVYYLRVHPDTGTWEVRKRVAGGASTQVVQWTQGIASSDQIGFRAVGSVLTAYRKLAADSLPSFVGQIIDTSIPGTGADMIGFSISNTITGSLDNVGGGAINVAASMPISDTDANSTTTEVASLVAAEPGVDANGTTTEAITLVAAESAADANGTTTEVAAIALKDTDSGTDSESNTLTAVESSADVNGTTTEVASISEISTDANGVTTETTRIAQTTADANGVTTETTSVSVPISGTDSGTDSEAASLVTSESASDANGTTTESGLVVATPSSSDSGTVAEANALTAAIPTTDANGATTESATISSPVAGGNDLGTITESATVRVFVSSSDGGSSTELNSLVNQVTQSDSGTEAEVASLTYQTTQVDAGAGSDVASLHVSPPNSLDSGTGTDTTAALRLTVADFGGVADTAVVSKATISSSDTGSVVETAGKVASQIQLDPGDTGEIIRPVTGSVSAPSDGTGRIERGTTGVIGK